MIVVEPVRRSDLEPLARLAATALSERYSEDWLMHRALQKRGTFLVARDVYAGQIVGFAVAQKGLLEGELLALAVDPSHQGKGIGAALLGHVQSSMATEGAWKMTLDVRADDPDAKRFYEHFGFFPAGLKTNLYSDGGDAIHMERPI
jgi:ribosomal-protein-alanine N-acetyltransferase